MKVLFIGNSHTYVHYVPLRVKEYCRRHGFSIDAFMLTQPGMGLDYHLEQSQTYFDLMCGDFDAVILQHKAHPFPGEDSLIDAVRRFKEITPEKTRIYLYETWSEKDNPSGQEAMTAAYRKAAENAGAALCPVGEVWHQVRTVLHPEAELYFRDGQHSSVLGASLSGCVIGSTLMGEKFSCDEYFSMAQEIAKMDMDHRMIDMK